MSKDENLEKVCIKQKNVNDLSEEDKKKIKKVIDEELREAEGRMLKRLGIVSGDISPGVKVELDDKEDEYKKVLFKWLKNAVCLNKRE